MPTGIHAIALIAGYALCASGPLLLPADIVDPKGVHLQAQLPSSGISILTRDESRTKLWYAPVAAIPQSNNTERIWYERVSNDEKEYSDQRILCVGNLKNGVWTAPALHTEALSSGGPNNSCMRRSPFKPTWGGFNVFQILRTKSGYEMLYWDQPAEKGNAGVMRASSRDGLVWEKSPDAVFTEHNDAYTVIAVNYGYLLYQTSLEDWPDKPYKDNLDKFRRVISLRESSDLNTWTPQHVFLRPDAQDPPETEFYLFKAFPYGGGFGGLLMKYYGDPKTPGKHSGILRYELLVSRDGRAWERPYRDVDLGFWSYADPFEQKDKLHFVIWKDNGMVTVAYPPGRLVGATAKGDGSFATPWLDKLPSNPFVDADASEGWIDVDFVDRQSGARWTYKRIQNEDGAHIQLALLAQIPPAIGTPGRFEFRLHNATVFGNYEIRSTVGGPNRVNEGPSHSGLRNRH